MREDTIDDICRAGWWRLANRAASAWSDGRKLQFSEYSFLADKWLKHEIEIENRLAGGKHDTKK